MADGRLLVAGGGGDELHALRTAFVYNPFGNPPTIPWWTQLPDMNNNRWYPTCTTLATREVLVSSGTISPGVLNHYPQVLHPTSLTWRQLDRLPEQDGEVPYYPWMHVKHDDGRVFHVGSRDRLCHYLNTAGMPG